MTGEEMMFHDSTSKGHLEGERKAQVAQNNTLKRTRNQAFHDDRMFGMEKFSEKHKSASVFRIKPYRLACVGSGEQKMYHDHYGDKIRVFAKCIGGGKPYEMIDVMLMTQSL